MKKLLFSAAVMGLLFTTSCKKDDGGGGKSCEDRSVEIGNAAQTFISTPNKANCERYKSALQDYFNSNCTGGAGSANYQQILDGLNCDEL